MKNFSLLLCLLCCHIIVSQCSLEDVAKQLRMPSEVMIECSDLAEMSESEIIEFFSYPPGDSKFSRKTDIMVKGGCFVACTMQIGGLMTGATLEVEALTQAVYPGIDSNSDKSARMQKTVKECAEIVEGEQCACKVALIFRECVFALMNRGP